MSQLTEGDRGPAAYANPYLSGVLLGLTLLASYLILGAGLGASAGTARLGAFVEQCLAPAHVAESAYFGRWVEGGRSILYYYLVFMFVGVFLGGLLSAVLASRIRPGVERGRAFGAAPRLLLALGGGLIAGFASRLANGCTSGQALSGGAMLLNGSLVFMACVFVGGYAAAWFVRRQWHD
ncbi:MAG: YeeE/YedE family protein [Planctomycetaceae bacterium]|nr:YeeE/YedE family protein [Planctomycetaceae bacterium]